MWKENIHVPNDQNIQNTISTDQNVTGSCQVCDIQFQMSWVHFTNAKWYNQAAE